jgi:hypothetical protein
VDGTDISTRLKLSFDISFQLKEFILFFWMKGCYGLVDAYSASLEKNFKLDVSAPAQSQFFLNLCFSLKMAYMVKYRALDRKLRKIVKNKYRYVRFYSMINPRHRIKSGLRLFLVGLSLRSNQKISDRLIDLMLDIFLFPSNSLLLNLRSKHQTITLTTLTLSM